MALGEIVATTLANRERAIGDAILNNNSLTYMLKKKGRNKTVNGGRTIYEPVFLHTNDTIKWYTGYETWSTEIGSGNMPGNVEAVDAAEYPWTHLGGFAGVSGSEEVQNRSKWRAVELAESRIQGLQKSMENTLGAALFASNPTATEINSCLEIIADAPNTGVVGGIDRSVFANWRNQTVSSTSFTVDNVQSQMNTAYTACQRGTDHVDLVCANPGGFNIYWDSLQAIQRIASKSVGEAGFRTIRYVGADVIHDFNVPDGSGSVANSMRMYFINTNTFALRYAPDRMFAVGDNRQIQDADYSVTPVWFMGQLTSNDPARNAVMFDSTP